MSRARACWSSLVCLGLGHAGVVSVCLGPGHWSSLCVSRARALE